MESVHFGKRLKKVRREVWRLSPTKPGTQQQAADFFFEKGALSAPNQGTIARWEKMKSFSPKIKEALRFLKEKGVDIDFLEYSHITEWKAKAEPVIDDSDVFQIRKELIELKEKNAKLEEANRKLIDLLSKLSSGE